MNKIYFNLKNYWSESLFLAITILLVVFLSILFLNKSFNINGQLGDYFNGITGPFINLVAAFFVYKSFREQFKANNDFKNDLIQQRNSDLIRNEYLIIESRIHALEERIRSLSYNQNIGLKAYRFCFRDIFNWINGNKSMQVSQRDSFIKDIKNMIKSHTEWSDIWHINLNIEMILELITSNQLLTKDMKGQLFKSIKFIFDVDLKKEYIELSNYSGEFDNEIIKTTGLDNLLKTMVKINNTN
jgi:hypothetical protein